MLSATMASLWGLLLVLLLPSPAAMRVKFSDLRLEDVVYESVIFRAPLEIDFARCVFT